MSRFIFFLLLLANVAFGIHLYLDATQPKAGTPPETNREVMKIISITDSAKAQQEISDTKKLVESMQSAACALFSIKPADAARAETAIAAMALGDRMTRRNTEEFSRFAVSLPIQRDRKAADSVVATLKKAGVKDMLIMADNSISLGLFSSDESARRVVRDLETKAAAQVKGISITAKNPTLKEVLFAVQTPDAGLVGRLALMQRDFEGSTLKGGDCPAAAAIATTAENQ
jgi:hypothetical protein